MDNFAEERKWFEKWVIKQFGVTPELLSRTGEAYKDETLNVMFIAFCAGWMVSR